MTEDDIFRAALATRRIFWCWRVLCWVCAFTISYGFYAVYQTSPEVPCGSSLPVPVSVQGIRVAGGAGRLVHAGQQTPSTEKVKESTEAMWSMVGLWLTAFQNSAAGLPPSPKEREMEAQQERRMAEREAQCATSRGPEISVASWNVLKSNSINNVIEGALEIFRHADVWGGQELGSEKTRARLRFALKGTAEMTTDGNAVPIMWRTDRFTKVAEGERKVLSKRRVSGEGGTVGPKSVVWVTLRNNESGALVTVMNTHLLWAVEKSGRSSGGASRSLAFGEHRDAVIALANEKAAEGIPVIITMDGNVDVSADLKVKDKRLLYTPFTSAGWTNNHLQLGEIPTHANRAIDVEWTKGAIAVTHRTGGQYGSDHRQIYVGYSPVAKEVAA